MRKFRIKKRHSKWWSYVWGQRKLLARVAGIALLAGIIITLSIPTTYEASVFTLAEARVVYADENGVMRAGSINQGTRIRDAVLPSGYKYVMSSPAFLLTLSQSIVRMSDEPDSTLTLYEYMAEHHRYPWWTYLKSEVMRVPGLLLSPFRKKSADSDSVEVWPTDVPTSVWEPEGVVKLTRRDAVIASRLRRCLGIEIDGTKESVTLMVRMQDPLVAAIALDSLLSQIQAYVTRYRMEKERQRLVENEDLLEQARQDYYKTQEEWANYADTHQGLSSLETRAEQLNLQIRMEQARREYERMSGLVEAGQRRAATRRPVLTVIQPIEVPKQPAGPSALLIILVCLVLGIGGALGWLWLKKNRFIIRWRKQPAQKKKRRWVVRLSA